VRGGSVGVEYLHPAAILDLANSETLTGHTHLAAYRHDRVSGTGSSTERQEFLEQESNDLAGRRSIFPAWLTGCRTMALRNNLKYRKRKWVAVSRLTQCRSNVEIVPRITPDFYSSPLKW
jgi:hypothetical protein